MDERDPAAFAASLTRVASEREIASLAPGTNGVVVDRLDDRKLRLLSEHAPQLRHILGDGKCRVTDAGLAVLARFSTLETLDLEFGAITDIGLARLAAVRSLRWVDLGGCVGVSAAGLTALRHARADVEIEPAAG